jgi:hypothetical protein
MAEAGAETEEVRHVHRTDLFVGAIKKPAEGH